MTRTTLRCGDHVHHGPSGEDWVVAYVNGPYLGWCGWPEGVALLSDCMLIKRCTDDEHLKLLTELAKTGGTRGERAQSDLVRLTSASPGA